VQYQPGPFFAGALNGHDELEAESGLVARRSELLPWKVKLLPFAIHLGRDVADLDRHVSRCLGVELVAGTTSRLGFLFISRDAVAADPEDSLHAPSTGDGASGRPDAGLERQNIAGLAQVGKEPHARAVLDVALRNVERGEGALNRHPLIADGKRRRDDRQAGS